MPTYDYVCDACEHVWERVPVDGVEADEEMFRMRQGQSASQNRSGAGIIFKGSGFYQTDYRSDSYKKSAEADSKSQKSSDSKSDSKPSSSDRAANRPSPKIDGQVSWRGRSISDECMIRPLQCPICERASRLLPPGRRRSSVLQRALPAD